MHISGVLCCCARFHTLCFPVQNVCVFSVCKALSCKLYLSQSLSIGAHVSQNDQDVLLTLVGQVLRGGQRQPRGDDAFDAEGAKQTEIIPANKEPVISSERPFAYVGSLARFKNRQTLSIEPFSSKSDLKKRAVSMLTWKVGLESLNESFCTLRACRLRRLSGAPKL